MCHKMTKFSSESCRRQRISLFFIFHILLIKTSRECHQFWVVDTFISSNRISSFNIRFTWSVISSSKTNNELRWNGQQLIIGGIADHRQAPIGIVNCKRARFERKMKRPNVNPIHLVFVLLDRLSVKFVNDQSTYSTRSTNFARCSTCSRKSTIRLLSWLRRRLSNELFPSLGWRALASTTLVSMKI